MRFAPRRLVCVGVFALAMTLSAGHAIADGLSGKVLDPDGRAVSKADIRLFNRNGGVSRSTVSAADGSYTFQGVPAGEYLVEAEASGKALTMSQPIAIKGDQKEDLKLTVSSRNIEVLVTASNSAQSVQEVAKAVDVVDADQIAMRDELSITEAIRNLPGIRVKTLEGPGSFTTIKTRGLRTQDTALLIDGMRFRDAASPQGDASAFLEDMVTADTDRIEFLRGSGSSLYGSNALAGVINITSKLSGGKPHGEILSEGGGLGLFRNLFSVSGGVAKDRLIYSNTITQMDTFRGVRKNTPYHNTSDQGSVRFSITPKMSVTGRMWYAHHSMTSTESPTFDAAVLANSTATGPVPAIALPLDQLELYEAGQPFTAGNATYIPNQIDPDGKREGFFLSGGVAFDHQVSSNTSYRGIFQQVSTRRTYVDGPLGPGPFDPSSETRSNYNGYTTVGKLQVDQRAGRYNRVTFGYEFERERYKSFDGTSYDPATSGSIELQQDSNAIFVQDQISLLGSQLQITAAGRTQLFSLQSPVFGGFTSPYTGVSAVEPPTAYVGDGAIAYFMKDSGTKVRAHVGNSFRSPSGYERYGGGGGFYYGDPLLRPERAIAVDGGVDQWIDGSRVQLSATWFYTYLQQVIRFANSLPAGDPYGRFFGYANGGGGISRGMELSAKFAPTSHTSVDTSYTYTNSDSKAPTVGTTYFQVLGVSPHKFSLAVTEQYKRLTVAFDMTALSGYTQTLFGGGQRLFQFTGPVTGDVVVRYAVPMERPIELYVKVNNLFNQRPYEDGFIGPKLWAVGGIRWKY